MSGRVTKTFWMVPLVFAALVAVLGWWGNDRVRRTLENQLKSQLTVTLDANVTALEIWAANQTRLATSLADDSELRKVAGQMFNASQQPDRETAMRTDEEEFVHALRPRLSQLGYQVAQLVNTN